MYLHWLVALLAIRSIAQTECPVYTCGSFESEQCIQYIVNSTQTTYISQACGADETCPPTQQTNSTCQPSSPSLKYPGDFCSLNSDCISLVCQAQQCVGLGNRTACKNVYDCDPGYQCDPANLTCQSQFGLGAACLTDYQCANNLLCTADPTYPTTNCTAYFSVPVGQGVSRLDNEVTGFSFACASGFAVSSGGTYTCENAPQSDLSQGPLPIFCDAGSMCSDSTHQYQVPCLCSYTDTADAFCSLFPGDAPVQSAISSMKKVITENLGCNTFSRFSFNCFATMTYNLQTYYEFASAFSLISGDTYPEAVTSPGCLQQIYTPDYYYQSLAQQSSKSCPIYTCSNNTVDLQPSQCVLHYVTTDMYVLQDVVSVVPCASGNTCNAGLQLSNYTCTPVSNATSYPGDPCNTTAQCILGTCSNNVCINAALGQNCSDVFDCNAGLFCNLTLQRCQTQVTLGGFCDKVYSCNNTLTCSQNQCIPYYSLGNGAQTDMFKPDGYSEACASGFVSLVLEGGLGTCAAAPVSANGSYQKLCTPGSSCTSADGSSSKECQCGFNSNGSAYCPAFEGDPPLQTAIRSYKLLVANATEQCNTATRNSYVCFSNATNMYPFFNYTLNLELYLWGHLLKNTAECFVVTFNVTDKYYQLYQLYQQYQPPTPTPTPTPTSSTVLTVAALLFALLVS